MRNAFFGLLPRYGTVRRVSSVQTETHILFIRMQPISIIIPALNEAASIQPTLEALQAPRARGHEIILSDGGSTDHTPELARPWVDRVLSGEPGRARQMNAGAAQARGEILWFLHADTIVPQGADGIIADALAGREIAWGRFDVRLSGRDRRLRLIERMMNWRSRLTGIATGDQGIFISRGLFQRVNGFAELPLMEDIELSRRLKRHARPRCVRAQLLTSSRRWEQGGVWRTVWLMWRLRLRYALGEDPARLARLYR